MRDSSKAGILKLFVNLKPGRQEHEKVKKSSDVIESNTDYLFKKGLRYATAF